MDMQKKKMIVIGSVVGGVIIIFLLVLYFGGWMRGGAGTVAPGAPGTPVAPGASLSPSSSLTNVVFNKSVYDVALARAVVWQSGAALAKMTLADTSGGTWDFIFVSSKIKNKGFEIVANGQGVLRANEIAIIGSGDALPVNSISPDEAMAKARAVPGYGNAAIVSLEMIYNARSHAWYWGVKTSTGLTVTIKATP